VRIPLDYYRILGLPIQATVEQLHQAHRDRALQLPRREYSEAAIAARRQLLDEAHAVLSDPEQRQAYDAGFLAKSYDLDAATVAGFATNDSSVSTALTQPSQRDASDTDPYTPSIEIQDDQLVGALLILLELGEYELVLKLGRPYLSSGGNRLQQGRFGEPDIVLADIVLTLAFACLELGREQWQQGQYENAAESLETGQELLLREGSFPSVRGEMQADLFKLRPYRVLEMLALPEENVGDRRQGLSLLRDMLQDRGGIDGGGDDQSGLNIDDFLRFIQQLRSYLTAAEQQTLFEAEARRPSAVATYLAVYAQLSKGFADRQPALIRRAKLMLVRLGTRQDVHLEQAVCALLLGQTEEASRALDLSQEYESLAFIREHSQGSPDLLPGLCLYSERWLQNEVFPHFRDLARRQASLKEYFADEQVQAYLEELPNEPEVTNQWAVVPSATAAHAPARGIDDRQVKQSLSGYGQSQEFAAHPSLSPTATIDTSTAQSNGFSKGSVVPTAERISPPTARRNDSGATADKLSPPATDRKRNQPGGIPIPEITPPRRSPRRSLRLDRIALMLAIGVLGVGVLSFMAYRASGPALNGEQLQVRIDQPPIAIPTPTAAAPTIDPNAPLTQATALVVVQKWLSTKTAALGSNHDSDQLAQILVDPALTAWQQRSQEAKRDGWYWKYEHQAKVTTVNVDSSDANQAQVEAAVMEKAELYTNGQLDENSSYDENLQVRYDLVRQDGEWRIKGMEVLP
jgi:hypothetical protein